MTTKNISKGSSPGTIAWVVPTPTFSTLVLGTKASSYTFTICNNSSSPVTITGVRLDPEDDSRIQIAGGSLKKGMVLLPKATVSIDIMVKPHALGLVREILCVDHNGLSSPLWIDIALLVARSAPSAGAKESYLVAETRAMDRQRRINEQEGHRRLARVNARTHATESNTAPAAEGELQNNILQNPWLDSQRFDGIDPNLNPEPPLNTEARREYDNERNKQELEKQLRLGNMPRFSSTPTPRPS